MAEWVEKGSLKGPPGEIPDVSDFLRDGDVSSAISGSSDKVASDKAVKDYADSISSTLSGQISSEATARQEADASLTEQIGGKANVEHTHEMADVTGLNDKISEIETSVNGKANATHTHTTSQVDGLDTKLSGIDDDIAAKADAVHTHVIADVTGLQTALDDKAASVHTHEIANVNGLQDALGSKADASHTHSADNITSGTLSIDRIPNIPDAKIDGMSATKLTGTVPQANLPSYVDDVIESDNYNAFPPTGESGKIYVDKQTNKTYRWGGSEYVEISESLALGETSSTAFRGDYGKTAYQHAQSKGSEFASGLYKIATNSEGHVTGAVAVQKSDITALGIPGEDTNTTYTAGSGLSLSGTEFGVADGGIIGRHLDDNCVMERNIVVNSVTSDKIPALAITTPKLVDNAVTAIKMADDAVATRSIQDGAVTAEKIAEGVIPEAVDYDVATTEANGLMSSTDKTALDNLAANAVTTDASGYVQKSPFKFKNYDGSVEMNFTSKTETSLDLEFKTKTGTDVVTISADNLLGEASGGIAMGAGATFDMGGKEVNGIVDAVGEGADGTKLATDKAVKDAIAAIEIPDPLPTGGTDGQVLTKTADGEAWEDIPDYENATTEYDGLMSAADKTKLDGIQAGANNYVHPASAAGAKASGFYKVQTDANGHVIGAVNVVKGDITALGIPAQDTTYVDATGSASGLMSAADKTKLDGMDTALAGKSDVGHTHEIANVNGLQTALDGKANADHEHGAEDIVSGTLSVDRIPMIPDSKIGEVSAEKITGTIPSENLPSYVDDVVEVDNYVALPPTGEAGKIYVDKETNKTYRWGGSAYVEISASLALGETSATAFRGDYGKVAYDHAQAKGSEFATGFYKIATNAEGHVTGATAVTKGDITALGVPAQDTTYADATGSTSGLMSAADKSKLDGIAEGADKLPDGGTNGQILTKTADGEAWQDAPEPDMTGVVKKSGTALTADDELIDEVRFGNLGFVSISGTSYGTASVNVIGPNQVSLGVSTGELSVSISATANSVAFGMGDKVVTSITDDASTGDTNALATAKAVKDYVDDHAMPSVVPISKGGTGVTSEDALVQLVFNSTSTPKASATQYGVVKFASDEDFRAFMGIS